MRIFTKREKEKEPPQEIDAQKKVEKGEESEWRKCGFCKEQVHKEEVEKNLSVCPKCSYHFPMSAEKRIALVFDTGTFTEYYGNLAAVDFLEFKDLKSYKSRLTEAREATGKNDTVVCGRGRIEGMDVLCAIFDFSFLGGSLGSVAGEKITRLLEEGKDKSSP